MRQTKRMFEKINSLQTMYAEAKSDIERLYIIGEMQSLMNDIRDDLKDRIWAPAPKQEPWDGSWQSRLSVVEKVDK